MSHSSVCRLDKRTISIRVQRLIPQQDSSISVRYKAYPTANHTSQQHCTRVAMVLFSPSLLYHQQFSRLGIGAYTSYERADGVYWFTLKNGIKTIHERRNNSDIKTWRSELNMSYQLTDKQTLQWKAYAFTSNRGLPGAVIYDNTYSAERLKDKNVFTQMLYENLFSNRIKMKAAAKWNYAWSRYSDIPASGYKERYLPTERDLPYSGAVDKSFAGIKPFFRTGLCA